MTKPKTLEQLRAEKERAETQLAQEQHKLDRLENRKKYLEKGERTKRTHRLCNLGGTVESLAPEVKDLTRTEMTELMEYIFSLSEVQRACLLYTSPIRDYLNGLEWDGTERIRCALPHFLGAEESEFTYECLRLFMLGAISPVSYTHLLPPTEH